MLAMVMTMITTMSEWRYLVGFEVSWRSLSCWDNVENRRNQGTASLTTFAQRNLDGLNGLNGAPALGNQT